jgi:hypothetical protein
LNIFNGLALFKRRLLQGGVRFCQLSAESLKELKISDHGDILLSILKSQEIGLEGSDERISYPVVTRGFPSIINVFFND